MSIVDSKQYWNFIVGKSAMSEGRDDYLVTRAVAEFGLKFAEYVNEMNPELWRRALDYAKHYTKVEGIEFRTVQKEENDNE